MPYRRLKKTSAVSRVDGFTRWSADSNAWHSIVQGEIRNLRPPYSAPVRSTLGMIEVSEAGGTPKDMLATVTVWCERLKFANGTLQASLDLLGREASLSGLGFGQRALHAVMQACGQKARELGATRLTISAVVHDGNVECQALLAQHGWQRDQPVPDQVNTTYWVVSGELGTIPE